MDTSSCIRNHCSVVGDGLGKGRLIPHFSGAAAIANLGGNCRQSRHPSLESLQECEDRIPDPFKRIEGVIYGACLKAAVDHAVCTSGIA
jgi:hypothetical protein